MTGGHSPGYMTSTPEEEPATRRIAKKIEDRVQDALAEDEDIKFSIPLDLSLTGEFSSSAFYLTDRRILSFDDAHPEGVKTVALADVEDARWEKMYGNSVLLLETEEEVLEINRCTNRYSYLLQEACDEVKKALDSSEGETLRKRGERRDYRCPKCGRTLPRRSNICPYCIDKREVITRLAEYIKPHWKMAALGLLTTFIYTALQLTPPYLTRILVDDVIMKKDRSLLMVMVFVLLGVYVSRAVFQGVRMYLLQYLGNNIVYDLRKKIYAKLQSLSVTYFDKNRTGSIMSRVSNDTQRLRNFIMQFTQRLLVQVVTLVGVGAVMFSMDWRLAALTVLPVPLVSYGIKMFMESIHPLYHRIWRRHAGLNAILSDTIPGIRIVKAFTAEGREVEKFARKGTEIVTERLRAAKMRGIYRPAINLLMTIGGAVIWGIGGYWVITAPETLSLGTLVAFIGYMGRFYQPIRFLTRLSDMMERGVTSAERVFEVLDRNPEPNYGEGNKVEEIEGRIEFRNVSFAYEHEETVLKNINLEIEPGETVGLVGATGAGKTTLANLVPRFHDPDEGKILLDGQDLMDIDIHSLREQIGVVLQDPMLFHDTLKNNITYNNPDVDFEDVIHATKIANAHEFISSFNDAYDTRIGERGVGLSGGEKQRISISRAVLKDPPILILDEATSAVDTETEKLIQEAIDRLIQDRTTVMIAHRLSTLRNADKIVVLEEGEVAEVGTHDELMEKEGIFHKLVHMQADMGTDMLRIRRQA